MVQRDGQWYDTIGSRYEDAYANDPGLANFLQRALTHLAPGSKVLDVGCGTGKPVATTLAAAGHAVTGIDYSDVMVELSKKAVPSGTFQTADMREYTPPEGTRFDAIFNSLSLFYLTKEEIDDMAARWSRWLNVGGILGIVTMPAEDRVPERRGRFDDDGSCARDVPSRFMGTDAKVTLLTRPGWQKLLTQTGFDIVDTVTQKYAPPAEADCSAENHYFIIAKKAR